MAHQDAAAAKQVLFVEFHNIHPHVEASFEIAKRHLDDGDHVKYVFLGHDVPYREFIFPSKVEATLYRPWLPERRAARLIAHSNFTFIGRDRLPIKPLPFELPTTLEELKALTHDGFDVGMAVASSLISGYRDSRLNPTEHQGEIRDALAGSIAVFDYTKELLASERPDLVYVFNGRRAHPRAVLRASQAADIDVRLHERGATKDRYVVRPFMPHDRAKIQRDIARTWADVTDREGAARLAEGWFRERRHGTPRDWRSFTEQQKPSHLPEVPAGKRILTYFSSSDDEFAAIGEEFRWEGWNDQLHAVQELIELVRGRADEHLVVRIHPHVAQKHPDEIARWLALAHDDDSVTVLPPESPVDTYAMIEASDVVITGGSTVGLEAVYWGTPSVLLGPSDYDELDAVHPVRSLDELKAALARDLTVDPASALPYGYYRATFGETYRYFEATTLFSGEFMSVELHRLPTLPRFLYDLRKSLFRAYRARFSKRPRRAN